METESTDADHLYELMLSDLPEWPCWEHAQYGTNQNDEPATQLWLCRVEDQPLILRLIKGENLESLELFTTKHFDPTKALVYGEWMILEAIDDLRGLAKRITRWQMMAPNRLMEERL